MISFKEFSKDHLTEVFDSPFEMKDGESDMLGFMMKTAAEMKGAKDVKVYDMGDSGDKVATFIHDGAMEIHHLHSSGLQGAMNPKSTKPNPRFVSTAIKLGKDHVESGGTVRIVGTPDVHRAFEPLAKRVTDRLGYETKSHQIADTSFYTPFPQTLHAIEIRKKS